MKYPAKSFKLVKIDAVQNDGYILNEFNVKLRITVHYGIGNSTKFGITTYARSKRCKCSNILLP